MKKPEKKIKDDQKKKLPDLSSEIPGEKIIRSSKKEQGLEFTLGIHPPVKGGGVPMPIASTSPQMAKTK